MKHFFLFVCIVVFSPVLSSLSAQGYVTNGSASSQGGGCYQLTPDAPGLTGNIFSQNPIDLTQPFYLDARFFFGCKDGSGADGIVFILATTNMVTGTGGGGIGYDGITPSIAIEFDDYFNSNFADPTSDHMAVISMGSVDHNQPTTLVSPINISNIEDCMDHCFAVAWDPITQTLTAVLDDDQISYTGNIIANIFSGNAQVYYGFSSGTGSLSNPHRVCFGPPALEPMPDVSICEGESIILEADPNGIAWEWDPDPTLSQLDINDPEATPDITTTYTTVIEYRCGYFHNDTVVVTVIPYPDAEASNDGPKCIGESIELSADGGSGYEWDGPNGFFSVLQNPTLNNVNLGDGGIYIVTVTDAAGCTSTAETLVEIDEGPEITIDPPPDPVCESQDPFLMTADPPGGEWDGDISPGGLFDPAYTGEGIQVVTYTATNSNGCVSTAQIDIEVLPIPEVLIDPPGFLCEGSAPIQMTGSPIGGIWEGEISINGIFNPAAAGGGPHLITYTANDGNGCTNSADIIIEVVPLMTAVITPGGTLCGTDTITFVADPPGGIWGGAADANGQILPYVLSGGAYVVTYELNNNNGCFAGEDSIDIHYPPPVLGCPNSTTLCFNSTPVILHADPPGGVWSGAADSSGLVDPTTLTPGFHMAIYMDGDTVCSSGNSCWTYIEILDAPTISNVAYTCDPQSTFYTVSFSILGGDTSSYVVTGSVNGSILAGLPYRFVSDPIPSGGAYSFVIEDVHQCDTDTVSGSFICNCSTNAGTMDLNLITACESEAILLISPTGVNLDPDDSLIYVLHLGFPDSILLTSDSPYFNFGPPLQTGVTYFVSSVAGNGATGIGVDLSDPCLSVSFGTPVMWTPEPSGGIGGTAAVCEGDSATLVFFLTGTGPFDVTYSDGNNSYTANGISPGHAIKVFPTATSVYTLTDIAETFPPFCIGHPGTTHTVEVFQHFNLSLSADICFGDSLFLGGGYQHAAGVYHDSLLTTYGCDSILMTILTVYPLDTTYLSDKTCDPLQTGVFTSVLSDGHGCDSTIITIVTFALVDTTLIQSNTCDQQAAGVFSNLFSGQDGCDSLVIETITYIPPDSTWISGTTCLPADAGTFIEVQMNGQGCDSFIIETILLIPSDTTTLTGETCDPATAGVHTQLLTNHGGCDSLVIETIALLPSDTTILQQFTCFPQDTGFLSQVYTNVYGCDSLLRIITSLAPPDSCLVPVIHREFFIPNIFSPNGDGINDYFYISSHPEALSSIPLLRIYDRWGGLVFEGIDLQPNRPEDGWDGFIGSDPANPAVFTWVAEVVFVDGKSTALFGDVTLVR